ncbi:MAG: N-acetylmuramoyl-L-alanine amidase [Clostridium sp.]|nr:N-acetylmuramoyl-L-alanine amidase [Clostridium sp.]
MIITIDSGHYGKYNQSPINKSYYESEFNWKMTNYMKKYFEAYGYKVRLTRKDINKDLDLYSRGKCAAKSDLFISIHSNACNTESVDYPVVIRGHNEKDTDKLALSLAQLIAKIMNTRQEGRTYTKTNYNTEWYGVLRGAKDVNIKYRYIIEHSFHTNKRACNFLLKDENIEKLAKAECELIANYFSYKKVQLLKVKVDNLNVRSIADWEAKPCLTVNKGDVFTIVDVVKAKNGTTEMYKLKSGLYITTSSKYVELI